MSKKGTIEVFQTKISRNDRFAQMSHQEKLIEQKKREIQAKLDQKQKASTSDTKNSATTKASKSPVKVLEKKAFNFNTFSNDGSFLNQFKQMKEKKNEQKFKSFKNKDHDRYSEDRNKNKWKRENQQKDNRSNKVRISRFSDKPPNFEPKINITTSYSNLISQQNFDGQSIVTAQDVTGQPLLKNLVTSQNVQYPLSPQNTSTIIAAPPILLNVPPPQLQLQQTPIVLPSASIELTVDLCPTTVITTVTLPPPTPMPSQTQTIVTESNLIALPTIELANIPPPNPIQVHNIPQPEPINTLTIPPPAPLQVQNIPPPSPIQLNEIPNPKPLDIMNIPTPNDSSLEKNISDPDFIKNIPPPNKSVPPPNRSETNLTLPANASTSVPTCIPPPNIMPPTSMPPPQQNIPPLPQNLAPAQNQVLSSQNITMQQNMLVPPPPQSLVNAQPLPPPQTLQLNINQQQIQLQTLPPPTQTVIQNMTSQPLAITLPMTLQNTIPVIQTNPVSNQIPPLMAQPILPPPGMGIVPPPPMNMSCPPPLIQNANNSIQMSSFINQQLMPMNVPPPQTTINIGAGNVKDMNTVFPPGSGDYEAMASLGRMVAQCGPGIEDIVRERKNQDPSLWFLFHKESSAYQQYQQLIVQFRSEMCNERSEDDYRPEDIYDPDVGMDDDDDDDKPYKSEDDRKYTKRKRKSRWGEKDNNMPPAGIAGSANLIQPKGQVLLTKLTRNDPGLLQYVLQTFGTANLDEEDWKKAEDNYKINVLYQDMMRKRQEAERLQISGKNKYEYDSDEDIDGGTWEHKVREKEMIASQLWATELNRQAEGKHHIGDFLPPDEFKKFMEKNLAAKEGRPVGISDYKDFKLKEDNIGFKMLRKLGWSEGTGLGSEGTGILEPVNKGGARDSNQGLGLDHAEHIDQNDDEYDAYRKRMMLAYRFRPNPLNNPRRPYY